MAVASAMAALCLHSRRGGLPPGRTGALGGGRADAAGAPALSRARLLEESEVVSSAPAWGVTAIRSLQG